jgi:cytochrome d ubiquinol oxidase subunit II
MAEAILLVMLVAAVLYAVFGGADFGLGMIEPWLGKGATRAVDAALSPIWEANHIWLVLLVVVAFVGFPNLFFVLSVSLHIPLVLALLGIIARGTAFTFRHYDPKPAGLRALYSWTFRAGSLLTPLFLGISVAAWAQGQLTANVSGGVYAAFVAPWNTPFCWATGVFVCALFAFQGAALLAAEQAEAPTARPADAALPHLVLARRLHILAIALGAVVFAIAYAEELPWLHAFITHPSSHVALIVSSILVPVSALAFARGAPWLLRLSVAGQVSAVLLGLFIGEYPILLRTRETTITLAEAVAPPATLHALGVALAIGLCAILPALYYLWRVYKLQGAQAKP